MFGKQNQVDLAKNLNAALHSLNVALNAVHDINRGLPSIMLNDAFGLRFNGVRWMKALSGANEGMENAALQGGFIDWDLPFFGRGQGQPEEAAGDDFINLAMGRGRGTPAGDHRLAKWRLRSPDWKPLLTKPLRKNFYQLHLKTALRSPAEIDAFREANGVTVAGRDVPKPLLDIDEAGFPEDLIKSVQEMKCNAPSRLQSQCWPVALSGRDLLVVARSESEGKAIGYLLPAVVHIRHQKPLDERRGPIVLVLAATHESAQETVQAVRDILKHTGLRVMCLSSGLRKEPQLNQLKDGAHVCIATPSRLVAFMKEAYLDLQDCSYLVVDGADRMVAMGLEKQLRTILKNIRPDRQTVVCIASRSMDIDHLTEEMLTDPVTVTIEEPKVFQNQLVEHIVLVCEEDKKNDELINLFQDVFSKESSKAIVFARSTQTVDSLVVKMQAQNWPAVGVHGKKQKKQRDWALEAFRDRRASVLVMTDIVPIGLKADDVRSIVNYDRPATLEDYTRRVEYAAHVDSSGKAYTFMAPSDSSHAKQMLFIFREAKQDIPRELLRIAKRRELLGKSRELGGSR